MKGLEMNESVAMNTILTADPLNGDALIEADAHNSYLEVEESFYEFLKDMKNRDTDGDDFSSLFIYL